MTNRIHRILGRERQRLRPLAFSIFVGVLIGGSMCAQAVLAQDKPSRFEVAPVFSSYHAHLAATERPERFQLGGRFTWNWLPHLALEAEYDSTLNKQDLQTPFEGGHFSQGLFGIKSGVRWKNWGLFAKFRPGFISFSHTFTSINFTTGKLGFARLTDAAFDSGGGAEFLLSRRWLFRYDASDVIVHQGPVRFSNNGQPVTFIPLTFNNFESEVSVAFRF